MGDESLPEQLGLGKYLEPSREEETLPEPWALEQSEVRRWVVLPSLWKYTSSSETKPGFLRMPQRSWVGRSVSASEWRSKTKTTKLNGRGLHRGDRFNNWRIHNKFFSKTNFLGMLSGRSRRLGDQTFLTSWHDLLPFSSFPSFPQSFFTLLMRATTTPEMKIHIKRSPNESSQLINGKTHFLTRDCESEMIMALKWNTVVLSKATKTRLESNGNRNFVKLEQISPEGGQ
jgi:hypothetical protein